MSETLTTFVRAHTRLAPVAFVPELRVYQAEEPIGLWELTEGEFRSEQPPPFWAFVWAGGQALARYVLDHPEVVARRRVLDFATGSGVVAIAAAKAGATRVRAVDIDPLALAAVEMNAEANGVTVETVCEDVLDGDVGDAEVVLVGDAFYTERLAKRLLRFLLRAARERGARVLAGDPGRAFLPRERFRELAVYDVPVPVALESVRVKRTTVWELDPRPPGSRR
ncbi:MAG TPA: 50S ribosomal protein L11 methyltransferase [Micromonospora sp.]